VVSFLFFCDTMAVAFFLHRGPLIRTRQGGLGTWLTRIARC
jgi:hypothetical protein